MKPLKYGLPLIALLFLCASLASGFTKDYFIWDRDANGNAGPGLQSILGGSGYTGDRNSNLPNLTSLLNYRTVWICLGMYPDADPMIDHPTEITTLSLYLANNDSTCVYMEGGDAWYCDPWTVFHNYFHLKNWGHSGMSDLDSLIGQTGTFAEGMRFKYGGENAFVDRLVIDSTSTSFYLFKNSDPDYGVMIAYDNGNCTYKTIASSCEFVGLVDGPNPSTKITLADSIMSFFCVPKVVLNYDLALISIPSPNDLTPPNEPVTPQCKIRNAGTQTATSVTVHMSISPGGYDQTAFVASLDPESTVTVSFSPDWTAGNVGQRYTVCAWTTWSLDQRNTNDTLCKEVTAWDDRWYIKSPWCSNGDSVLADGAIGASEWTDAVVRDVSDFLGRRTQQPPGMALLYVMNDSFNVYLALDAVFDNSYTEFDAWDMFFEDNYDRSWPVWPDSSEGELRFDVREFAVWFWYTPFFSDSTEVGYYVSVNGFADNISGHMQYEYIIPFGSDSARGDSIHPNLWTDLCDTFGFWMTAADDERRQVYAWWPTSSYVGFGALGDIGMIILNCGLDRFLELEVVDIVSPPSTVVFGQDYPVTVRIRNNGNMDEQGYWVSAFIGDSMPYTYADSAQHATIGPNATLDVDLAFWHVPSVGTTYNMCAYVAVVDSDTTNNDTCKQVTAVITGVEELGTPRLPVLFSLAQNSPNPFTEATSITYAVPKATNVTLRVFDITGSEVQSLVNDEVEPGFYTARWDGRNTKGDLVPNGVYFLKMYAGTFSTTRKMVLLR